jgi:hypothetical protein
MEVLFVFLLAFATSIAAYSWAVRRGISKASDLRSVALTILECLGTAMVFLAVNVVLGTGLILAIRSGTSIFVPVYAINPPLLFVLSLLQGFVFQLWWRK